MLIRDRLKKSAQQLAKNESVADVRIGLCYVAVQLENGATGLAYIFLDSIQGGCSAYESLRPLTGRSAQELLELFDSTHMIASAIALATANALFNKPDDNLFDGPSLGAMALEATDKVAMVGHFAPLVKDVCQRTEKLYIFERQARPADDILDIEQAGDYFPECQVAILSSTSIINNSIDRLLALAAHCREVVLVGSSTPLISAAFDYTPVTLLSGITIRQPQGILQCVSEGGGTPSFKPYTEKVNLRLTPNENL